MGIDQARLELLSHSRSKRNGIFPALCTHQSQLKNPICGDEIRLQLHVVGERIEDLGFAAKSCALCAASASMLTDCLKGLNRDQAIEASKKFEETLSLAEEEPWPENLARLESFQHLRVNRTRWACALLPWIALRSALKEISS